MGHSARMYVSSAGVKAGLTGPAARGEGVGLGTGLGTRAPWLTSRVTANTATPARMRTVAARARCLVWGNRAGAVGRSTEGLRPPNTLEPAFLRSMCFPPRGAAPEEASP